MINKQAIIVIGIVAILGIAAYAGILPTFQLYANTETQTYCWHPDGDQPTCGVKPPELCDEENLVTSWQQGGQSVKLTFEGNIKIPECGWTGLKSEIPCYYYYVVSIDEGNGWEEIFSHSDYDQSLLTITHPSTGHPGEYMRFDTFSYYNSWNNFPVYDHNGDKIDNQDYMPITPCQVYSITTDAFSIELLDPHVGKLKTEMYVIFYADWLGEKLTAHKVLSDEVNLLTGEGDIKRTDTQTVFEEGETVHYDIETGYSGITQGGDVGNKGWTLRLWDNHGQEVKNQGFPMELSDDRHYSVEYEIPDGAYDDSGSNKWTIELWNVLFEQFESDFFAVGPGMADDGPERPTITWDQQAYHQGDEATVTIHSEPNCDEGNCEVEEFYVKVYYGTSGVDTVSAEFPKYVEAVADKCTVKFDCTRNDAYVTIEATAFDNPHNQGGLPSEIGYSTRYISDTNPEPGSHVVNVFVKDTNGDPVKDVLVDIGGDIEYSNYAGEAIFNTVPDGTYQVKAEKDDMTGSALLTVDGKDTSIEVTIAGVDWVMVLVCAIIFIVGMIVVLMVPSIPQWAKVLIIFALLGVVIALYWIVVGTLPF